MFFVLFYQEKLLLVVKLIYKYFVVINMHKNSTFDTESAKHYKPELSKNQYLVQGRQIYGAPIGGAPII